MLNIHLWRYLEKELVARMQAAERAHRGAGRGELNQNNHNGAAIPHIAERGTLEQYQRAVGALAEFLLHRRITFVQDVLEPVLKMAVEVTGADMGNIQMFDREEGVLKIKTQRGFQQPFLDFFACVHDGRGASCGAALQLARRVVVDDVRRSPTFAGTGALEVLLDAGVEACQSTPMIGPGGEVVGMLNTHYRRPTRPSDYDL